MTEGPEKSYPPSETLRDALARRVYFDTMIRQHHVSEPEVGARWASSDVDAEKRAAFLVADDMLDTVERWIGRTPERTLAAALALRRPRG
jgi:hypothetical protein